jgi:hypothetical protein
MSVRRDSEVPNFVRQSTPRPSDYSSFQRKRLPTPTNAFHIDADSVSIANQVIIARLPIIVVNLHQLFSQRPSTSASRTKSPSPNIRTATEAFLQSKGKTGSATIYDNVATHTVSH